MKKENKISLFIAVCALVTFIIWTILVSIVDVQAIGPNSSSVGFATVNKYIHDITGENMLLYDITDWLGLVPLLFVTGFALFGIIQLLKRKNIKKVDKSILILGGFYVVVLAVFILFEFMVINYRPVLIDGRLEASYPSSTTMLVMCVIPTTIIQLNSRIKNIKLKQYISFVLSLFIVFMVVARLLSGVHWFTDIIGGALFSIGAVESYRSVILCYS